MKLGIGDIKKLNDFFLYAVKRKFNLDGDNTKEFLFLSDVLISLFFKDYTASKSKLAISVIGSFLGTTLIDQLNGTWDSSNALVKNLGPLKAFANPFTIAYERLSRGFNRSIARTMEDVFARSGESFHPLDEAQIRESLSKLEEDGWFQEALNLTLSESLPLSLRKDFANIVGIFMRYLNNLLLQHVDIIEKFLASSEEAPLGMAILKNVNIEEFLPKLARYLNSSSPLDTKLEAISTLGSYNCSTAHEILWDAFKSEREPFLKIFIAQFLKNPDDKLVNEVIKRWESADDPMEKLALINVMQSLRSPKFKDILIPLLSSSEDDLLKEEAVKTFQYIPLEEDEVERFLRPLLGHPNSNIRIAAAYAIAYSKHPQREQLLTPLLEDEILSIREHVKRLIQALKIKGEPTFFMG